MSHIRLRKKCYWIKSISFQKHVYHGFKSICYRISNILIGCCSIFLWINSIHAFGKKCFWFNSIFFSVHVSTMRLRRHLFLWKKNNQEIYLNQRHFSLAYNINAESWIQRNVAWIKETFFWMCPILKIEPTGRTRRALEKGEKYCPLSKIEVKKESCKNSK